MQFYFQIFLFTICSNFLAAQIFRSDSPYAIKNEPFTSYCDIIGDDVPNTVEIKKEHDFYSRCTVDLKTCSKKQNYFGVRYYRYDCGCVDNNKKMLYMNTSRASLEDEGSWVCRPSYGYLTPPPKMPPPVFLPVYYGPEAISVEPYYLTYQTFTMIEGETYTFSCEASCNPPCSVNWFKNSTDESQMISPNGNLTFVNVDKSLHETSYFCQVSNSELGKGETRSTFPVLVMYGPTDIEFNVANTLTVNEGEDFLNISCSADCYPYCKFRWIENEESRRYRLNDYYPYTYGLHYYGSYSSRYISTNGTMSLYHVNRRQAGYFTCEVESPNTNQISKRNITLLVQYAPDMNITLVSNNETSEGSEVVIDCSVDSVPEANISWYRAKKKNTVISTGESLIIPEATCSDSDTYFCLADNGVGSSVSRSVSLLIKCIPKIDSENNDNIVPGKPVVVDSGGTAVLPIYVIANPRPSFSWYRFFPSGIEKSVTDFRMKQVDTEFSSVLTIENMNAVDYGYYKVYVSNSEGVRSQLFEVVLNITSYPYLNITLE